MLNFISQDAKRPLLDYKGISEHLHRLNYPEKALYNFEHCGEPKNIYILGSCGCGTYPIQLKINCDNKFCPICSKKRNLRLKKRLLPYLKFFQNNSSYKWHFLTISPESYKSYEEGKKDIRMSWKRFLKRSYVKERIEGGFMSVEVTNKNGLWHFHIHAIIYSRRLGNTLRGYCPHCHQNYIKYNKDTKNYYCANKNCNQIYEGIVKESQTAFEFSQSSNRDCFIDISQARSPKVVLNYMLKYLTMDKDSFSNIEDYAHHIANSYKDRQINSFGKFYDFKKQISKNHLLQEIPRRCKCCGEIMKFQFDWEVSEILANMKNKPPPDLDRKL